MASSSTQDQKSMKYNTLLNQASETADKLKAIVLPSLKNKKAGEKLKVQLGRMEEALGDFLSLDDLHASQLDSTLATDASEIISLADKAGDGVIEVAESVQNSALWWIIDSPDRLRVEVSTDLLEFCADALNVTRFFLISDYSRVEKNILDTFPRYEKKCKAVSTWVRVRLSSIDTMITMTSPLTIAQSDLLAAGMTPLLKHMGTLCRLVLSELKVLRKVQSQIEKDRILFSLEEMKKGIRPDGASMTSSKSQGRSEPRRETFDFAMQELDDHYVKEVEKRGIRLGSETTAPSTDFLLLLSEDSARREFELQRCRPIKRGAI